MATICLQSRQDKPKSETLIVLLGPTASGKTDFAIQIAKKLDIEIINVDSRQVYIGMDIGTAKPTDQQQQEVVHHLLDIRPPNQPLTLREFQKEAEKKIKKALELKGIAFLVGGSGLYLKALTAGLCPPAVSPQPFLRSQFQQIGQKESYQLLEKADPKAAGKINPSDAVRTERALEVLYATGKPISIQQKVKKPSWRILEFGLNPQDLDDRIKKRTSLMYSNGLIEETAALIKLYGDELPMLQTIGYAEAQKVLQKDLNPAEAIALTTRRTKQFAKRQRTWFRKQHSPEWLNPENGLSKALTIISGV